ncbi:conjugal transfer protein TraG N-terminal domain-containing protein [Gilliamella sp. B2776]|uniref:conjugal transfer protein TraG N-terminal domain-containing protein n=1 Tax=unclassified Gilliamella TaxID=2685620 RepID=UPI002269A8F4|nr:MULTISPECIES: conjugal transfer protein TraG N-terminal domain-containing protein [unclassified Gilliamella]MCX8578694.1 conjugal transfer protein TraG N-terminal domain-containing protein [Gilliamella sp. B2717]MCX8649576.1 conjugal transfer protein TraG N-terminal domain-containing protein [Gilliamella sp. B2779]MCX8654906.1 conjugal transfer protein TraG N-terminal domain-containing protein [Gilliamella sp. B2737]MCX8691434.1 conjugal transfer protein TraG N-terminal domain-containing pro
MSAMSFFDYVTLSLAWLINNGIWNIISTSGIFILPFIFKMLSILMKIREDGELKGKHANVIVTRLETYVYISMVVIFFACYPSIPLDIRVLHYEHSGYSAVIDEGKITQQKMNCSYAEISPENSSFKHNNILLSGKQVYVPIWWYFVHSLSSGVTQSVVTTLPCNTDLREVRSTISELAVTDPILKKEANEFYSFCFNPSFNKLSAELPKLPDDLINDVTWLGSSYYLNTPGYYDSFRAQKPQKDWPYDEQRDVGLTPGDDYTGYPSCKAWWSDSKVGLKKKIIDNINLQIKIESNEKSRTGNINPNINKFSFWEWITTNQQERDEIVLRSVLSAKKMLATSDYMFLDYGNKDPSVSQQIGSAIASTGVFFKSMTTFIEVDALRQAAPMLQSVLLMSVIILLPIIILIGGFEPKTVITLTFIIFSLIFLTFVWELARFLDSRLINIMYENNAVQFMTDRWTSDKSLIDIITSIIFIGFPIILLGSLSWAGVKTGVAINSFMDRNSSKMLEAGKEGINKAKQGGQIATKVITKGKSK